MTGQAASEIENDEVGYWQKWQVWIRSHKWVRVAGVVLFLLLLALAAALAMAIVLWAIHPDDSPSWTGFGSTDLPLYTGIAPYKNLWDWFGLLIVPLALAAGAALIGRTQQSREFRAREFEHQQAEATRQNEWAIEKDRQEQVIVADYYQKMSDLMLEHNLRSSATDDDVRYIARAISLGVFHGVNAIRKGEVLRFLYEADLINMPKPVVNLRGADLSLAELESADLSKAHLAGTDLHEAKLTGAILAGANLNGANLIHAELRRSALSKAILSEAYLSGAHLREADLNSANLNNTLLNNASLIEADLQKADLSGSNLVGADLSRAALQGADLSQAKSKPARAADDGEDKKTLVVSDATYDETTTWPDNFDPVAHGAKQLQT